MSSKGVLLFCFDTDSCAYHKMAERCVELIHKNLALPITMVTNPQTRKRFRPGIDVQFITHTNETGNTRGGHQWHNLDRCEAYRLSPYDTTLLMDIDYLPFTDNLLQYMDLCDDFLIHDKIHDLTGKNLYDFQRRSIIPMLWATVIVFRKTKRSQSIFEMVKYVKKHYRHFCNMYRIDMRNFRNDYAFTIALNQINGNTKQCFLPGKLPTLPAAAKVKEINEHGVVFVYDQTMISATHNQDVHVIDKEMYRV